MRKRIRKIYYKEQIKHPEPIEKLPIYAHIFKYDQKQIEYGLDMFVARGELKSYEKLKIGDSKDAYILIFSPENRSQCEILAAVPEEIDLNNVKLEPVPQNQAVESAQAKTTSAESVAEISAENNGPF
ncbi:MAG: hypothetical protein IJW25_01205 [Clostridia bacterium]|nr:hypothetical protein [Candidatus Gastranaerophilales bacterium]MBQ9786065.1 hypothetical protein [Clostridia bacterium]